MNHIKVQMDGVIASTSAKVSGNEIVARLVRLSRPALTDSRPELVGALKCWLAERTEPRTMYAVDIAKELGLSELTDELSKLLHEIRAETVFAPYCARWVEEAVNTMVGGEGLEPPTNPL